jgi:hypothetical protein
MTPLITVQPEETNRPSEATIGRIILEKHRIVPITYSRSLPKDGDRPREIVKA